MADYPFLFFAVAGSSSKSADKCQQAHYMLFCAISQYNYARKVLTKGNFDAIMVSR